MGKPAVIGSLLLAALCACMAARPARVQAQTAGGCAADSAFSLLDFWVGEWDVFTGDQLAGTDRVEKILSGCALIRELARRGRW